MNESCTTRWNNALARLSAVPEHLKLALARKMANQILDETRTPCPNGGSSVLEGGNWLMNGTPVIPELNLSECEARGILECYLSTRNMGGNYAYRYFNDGKFSAIVAGRRIHINVASGTVMMKSKKHQPIATQYETNDCGGSGYSKVD